MKIVTTGNEYLIERFGKYHRKLTAGWHFVIPVMESVSMATTTREQVLDVPPQQCYTKDNAPVKADAVVYMRIISLEAARYQVNDLYSAILSLVLTQIREEMGKLTLDETFSSRQEVNEALLRDVNKVTYSWGVEITRIEVLNIDPSPDILKAMELQMAAERRKRASVLTSEGERLTLINEAEGRAAAVVADAEAQRQAVLLQAEAAAERLRIEAQGLRNAVETIASSLRSGGGGGEGEAGGKSASDAADAALSVLMLRAYMDAQGKFAESEGTKLLMFPTKDTLPVTYQGLTSLLK